MTPTNHSLVKQSGRPPVALSTLYVSLVILVSQLASLQLRTVRTYQPCRNSYIFFVAAQRSGI
jgi:hypothetical protein